MIEIGDFLPIVPNSQTFPALHPNIEIHQQQAMTIPLGCLPSERV